MNATINIPVVVVVNGQEAAKGDANASGIEQVLKLIISVVDRQEERARTRKASHH